MIEHINNTIFESIKHVDEEGCEYWLARELQQVLEYKKWEKFLNVINNAKTACENSENKIDDNFLQVGKIVKTVILTQIDNLSNWTNCQQM